MKSSGISNLIIASIGLTLATMALTFYSIRKNLETNGWVTHTYEVINQATELLSTVKDAETGQRGYIITGDTAYLQPYLVAEKTLNLQIGHLKKLVSDNPAQTSALAVKIEPLIDLRIAVLRKTLFTRDHFSQDSAFALIRKNEGKRVMDSLRFYLKKFTDEEYVLLGRRNAARNKFYSVVDTSRYISLLIIVIISIMASIALYHKQKQNKRLVDRMRRFTRHLEKRVTQRTQELEDKTHRAEQVNEELRVTMEQLRQFHDALQVQNTSTEEALAEIRDLYDNSPCGYHSLDADGFYIRVNTTELSWLGYSREELIGKKKFRELVSDQSLEQWQGAFDDYKVSGSVANIEFNLVKKDGTIFPILLNSSALYDTAGNFVMSRSTIFDLTKRKKMEHQLKEANDKLTRANDEKNNFLGMASHDLKSPLNSVLGLITLLKMDSGNLTADQLDNLNMISDASRQMKAMIEKLLDLNRIEQGKSMVQKTTLDFISLIEKNLGSFKDYAAKKEIELVFQTKDPIVWLNSDPALINQIVDNLVSNAIKFSPAKKRVWIMISTEENNVHFLVRDEGPGIKPNEFHKLFNKFQKLSARPTGGETSTGLGLSIVKELVATLDGKISCQSTVGVGTTFILILPVGDTANP